MPSVTIAIPTFNRPEGLRNALISVLSQTYSDFTVIVSDNASTDENVSAVIESFTTKDSRIKKVKQETNIGPFRNFICLSKLAETKFLIFLADDDMWPPDHLEKLICCMDEETLMVFPDADLISEDPKRSKKNSLKNIYKSCKTDHDYLEAWCNDGSGQPFYGLYNIPKMKDKGLEFEFMEDLKYFNEGLFLHKLFLAGSVRFARQTSVKYRTGGRKGSREELAGAFLTYTERVVRLYLQEGNVPKEHRDDLMELLVRKYMQYFLTLCSQKKNRLPIRRRLSVAARVLASGR
jgi:glycosyltransferase involved in cell wall biosynthesis